MDEEVLDRWQEAQMRGVSGQSYILKLTLANLKIPVTTVSLQTSSERTTCLQWQKAHLHLAALHRLVAMEQTFSLNWDFGHV